MGALCRTPAHRTANRGAIGSINALLLLLLLVLKTLGRQVGHDKTRIVFVL
jgi:hypothetical protein